jgi:hypothetical protein
MPEPKKMERVFHTWDQWECYPAGFYGEKPPKGMTNDECELAYRDFLSDSVAFSAGLGGVLSDWVKSCEHYLTNENMNRIAWLGQSAMCYATKVPSRYRGGYNLLTDEQKEAADSLALVYLNKWLVSNGYQELTPEEAQSRTQANLY